MEEHIAGIQDGSIPSGQRYQYQADLESFSNVKVPIEELVSFVFGRLQLLNGRALAVAPTIAQSVQFQGEAVQKRENLIVDFKARTSNESHILFFGLPTQSGMDKTYPDTVDAIYSYTDDCLFFSKLICEDLMRHGEKTRDTFVREFGADCPFINEPIFADVEKMGLMPDEANYGQWATNFLTRGPPTKGIWDWLKFWRNR